MLIPAERATDHPVPVDKDNAAGLGAADAREFERAGVARLDALSEGWAGLVADVLGIEPATASAVITEARGKVTEVQGTLRMLSGVTSEQARTLADAGITGVPELANADPAEIERLLQTGSSAYVSRLIDEARAAVPAEQWRPGANIGLKAGESEALARAGIRSIGDLKRASRNDAGRSTIKTALGASEEALSLLATNADRAVIEPGDLFRTRRLGAAPAVTLTGITDDIGTRLSAGGLTSIADLASADPAKVAQTLGAELASARQFVNLARLKLGQQSLQ
jgi:predicted RecB family nuclease